MPYFKRKKLIKVEICKEFKKCSGNISVIFRSAGEQARAPGSNVFRRVFLRLVIHPFEFEFMTLTLVHMKEAFYTISRFYHIEYRINTGPVRGSILSANNVYVYRIMR